MEPISVGPHVIEPQGAPIIVAEIGINHNGNLELAKRMIEAASSSGGHMIKLQSFQPERFATPDVSYYTDLKRLSFTFDMQRELFTFAKKRGATLFSAPFDTQSVDFLMEMDVVAFKIASMDCNNIPLIRHIAKQGKPLFLSTGMASLEEIDKAVKTIKEQDNNRLVLMHCVSDYPARPQETRLGTMTMLAERFGCLTGFSDHTIGIDTAVQAASFGACVIEKHFTLDRKMCEEFPFSDHAISIEPEELAKLTRIGKTAPSTLTGDTKKLSPGELANRDKNRRGIYATQDLEQGTVLTEDDCIPLRPVKGISVSHWDNVIGKKLKLPGTKGGAIRETDLEGF